MDPMKHELVDISNNEVEDINSISSLEALDQWTSWRNDLVIAMYSNWLGNQDSSKAVLFVIMQVVKRVSKATLLLV